MTKNRRIAFTIPIIFILGIICGRLYQNYANGYHYEVLNTESFPFEKGHVEMSYVNEAIGFSFIDPETSVLTLVTEGGLPLTIYKAKRIFQESYPYIKDVSIEKNIIEWDDGENTYQLKVKQIKKSNRKTEQDK